MLQKRNDLFWTEGIQIWKERDASVIKGHNSDKNRQIKKSWRYVQLHIMGNHPTKYERNPSKGKWLVAYTRIVDGRTDRQMDGQSDYYRAPASRCGALISILMVETKWKVDFIYFVDYIAELKNSYWFLKWIS